MGKFNVFKEWEVSEIISNGGLLYEISLDEFIQHAREIYDEAMNTKDKELKRNLFIKLWHPPIVPTYTCPYDVFKKYVKNPDEMISSILDGTPIPYEKQWDMLVEMYKMMEEEIKKNREEYENLYKQLEGPYKEFLDQIIGQAFDF